jgi:hypothetical protein
MGMKAAEVSAGPPGEKDGAAAASPAPTAKAAEGG